MNQGPVFWIKESINIEAAHQFINAMYTQEADQSRENNSALYPEKSILDRFEKIMVLDNYNNNTYEDLWSSLK